MNDIEYDIIDELYFVTPYQDIAKALKLQEAILSRHLADLLQKGYIKAFYPNPDTEIPYQEENFQTSFRKYFYLATKTGLILHNSR